MVRLVPSRQTHRATDVAELMFEAIYKLHGLPERIVSDRDSLFTSKFWRRLHCQLQGTELRMSSTFHPQTDGAMERANRMVTQMIRQCVRPDQKDWSGETPSDKLVIMSAHDSIIAARIVNTVQANRKRASVNCKVGDLVYLSTKKISPPKGRARNLAPKYLGLFAISRILKEGATYQLSLEQDTLQRFSTRVTPRTIKTPDDFRATQVESDLSSSKVHKH